jgi:GAF domain-containing protein
LTGEPVTSDDLRADGDRWPDFVPVAVAAGYHSVHAYPLRVRDVSVGALGVFNASAAAPTDEEIKLTRALAHVATIALLQKRAITDAQLLTAQLQEALDSRVIIEQAKGVLTEQAQIDMDEAFARLRRHARDHNLLLTNVAQAVATRTLRAEELST